MVLFFIYPGINKKTKINAHELEALRFILRFLLTRYERTENTHIGRGEPRHHSGRQGRAGGRAGCTLCGCGWLRACTHAPCEHQLLAVRRADERSGSGRVEFWEQTRIQKFATCYRQVRLVCVCVRARKHVGTNFIPALTHTVIICVCVCMCMYVCMYVCM